eukprot:EG_transcript_29421
MAVLVQHMPSPDAWTLVPGARFPAVSAHGGAPRTALVHNPYSFDAYDVVVQGAPAVVGAPPAIAGLAPEAAAHRPLPPSPPPALSPPADPRNAFHPAAPQPADLDTPTLPTRGPDDGSDALAPSPAQLPKRRGPNPAAPDAAASPTRPSPALHWRRYGTSVSHIQALKELQAYTKRHPNPPAPAAAPLPVVWVGPPLPLPEPTASLNSPPSPLA